MILPFTPVLFLKAIQKKRVWVPDYSRKDGTQVKAHWATVKASTEHDDAKVAGGGQSFYQKQAHAHLAKQHADFHGWKEQDKVGAVLHLASQLQDDASASAAVSGFKKSLMAGKRPKPAERKAFDAAPDARKADVLREIAKEGGADHFNEVMRPDYYVSAEGEGYALKDGDWQALDAAKKAKPKAAAKKKKGSRVLDPKVDDLLAAIAKSGGLDVSEAKAQGIDPAYFKRRGYAIFRVFHKNGKTFDDMAHNTLGPAGYPVAGGANELLEQLSRALNQGEKVYTSEGHEAAMARAAEDDEPPPPDWLDEQFDPFAAAPGFEFAEAEYEPDWSASGALIFELAAEADKIKDGEGRFLLEDASSRGFDDYQTIQALQSFLNENAPQSGEAGGTPEHPGEAGGERQGGADSGEKEAGGENVSPADFPLPSDPDYKDVAPGKLEADAKSMGNLNKFLDKYVAEYLPEHADSSIRPKKLVHDHVAPSSLNPTEWEDWDEHKTWSGDVMTGSQEHIARLADAVKQGKRINPVLVQGHKDDPQYNPAVVDGHHRVAAHIVAGASKMPVIYDVETLIRLWRKARGVKSTSSVVKVMADAYAKHLKDSATLALQKSLPASPVLFLKARRRKPSVLGALDEAIDHLSRGRDPG